MTDRRVGAARAVRGRVEYRSGAAGPWQHKKAGRVFRTAVKSGVQVTFAFRFCVLHPGNGARLTGGLGPGPLVL